MQQALAAAQSRIAGLEKRLAEETRPSQEPGGSFLSGVANLFRGGTTFSPTCPSLRTNDAARSAPVCTGVHQCSAANSASRPERGGFLQGALSTAAGVAGELFFSKAFRT